MRRLAFLLSPALVLGLGLAWSFSATSCATYRQDLERARAHYDKNEFEPALALFRVLEPDVDSFSPAEHAQYAYSRGMTDYRLAGLANPGGSGMIDPRKGFRDNARHWLAVAQAIEKKSSGGLNNDEKARLEETLRELNRDVYGGGDAIEGDGGAPDGAPAK